MLFLRFLLVLCLLTVGTYCAINVDPYYLCAGWTNAGDSMVVWTYVAYDNETIAKGDNNKVKIGSTVITDADNPTVFTQNDDISISFPLAVNFETREGYLWYINMTSNQQNIPTNSPLFSSGIHFASTDSTQTSWKIGGTTVSRSWFTDAPLCCTSQCSYLSSELACKTFSGSVTIMSVAFDTYASVSYPRYNATEVPRIITGYVVDYYGGESDGTHVPFDPNEYMLGMTTSIASQYVSNTSDPDVYVWDQILNMPPYFTTSNKIKYCLESNCAVDCIIIELGPIPSHSSTPTISVTRTRSPTKSITRTPTVTRTRSKTRTPSPV